MSALRALHLPTEPLQHATEKAAESLHLERVLPDRVARGGDGRHRRRTALLLGLPVIGAAVALLVRHRRAAARLAEQQDYLAAA